ncbi:unnamed protein product [Adineta ricciae]|uniref:Cation-transporting P-type ATPase N-terminal domain-containing protein n=1 Tax=Adineta ricciae TaxID=249248 RepID=A0A813SRJ9_ADIRI|nr:unnamed protein product [Adineta ricciae]CAF0835199.1 unnamed protein product [Adineta ricciae]
MNTSQLPQDIHKIPLTDLFQHLHTNPLTGLSNSFVRKAKAHYGRNSIPQPKQAVYNWLLLKRLITPFSLVLWLAGILAILAYKPLGASTPSTTTLGVGIVIFLVIICNAVLNVYQRVKSIKIVASFSKLLPTGATVRRDGIEQQINVSEIVPGDIILIRTGDKLPADCRFFVCNELEISTSDMTGESKLITTTVQSTNDNFMESTNIGFYSSLVVQGAGEAVVIAIGENTVLGKMSQITQSNHDDRTTDLDRVVNRFVLHIVIAAIICVIFLWITWAAWLRYAHPAFVSATDNVLNSVGLIISFLPFNLASAITIVLTIVARQLYQHRILVNSLQIVEKFNSVSVITTDKTGTLTESKMTVTNILWDIDGEYRIIQEDQMAQTLRPSRIHFMTTGRVSPLVDKRSPDLKIRVLDDLLLGAALCNDASTHLVNDTSATNADLRLVGNPVDTALYNLCVYHYHMDINEIRCLNARIKTFAFNSTNKFMISANRVELSDGERMVLVTMKGASDNTLQRCSSYKTSDNRILPLTPEIREKLCHRQERLGNNSHRVIAMCQQTFTQVQYDYMMQQYEARRRFRTATDEDLNGFPTNKYCFIGFFSLFDPPRTDVSDSILKIRAAHIRVAMITGDHPTTAKAISKQVNILSSGISKTNGIDTFKIEQNERKQTIFQLYRNETFLQCHATDTLISLTVENNNDDVPSKMPWYRRWHSSPHAKQRTIPYAVIVNGSQIDYMDEFMWNWVLSHEELIFARTSPEQKLRIIVEFQRREEIVAAVGDGTNDAPSLKCADIGIAMQSGANVSKEASDMILVDNRFSSIISAIETGRVLSDNLKKVIMYLLPAGTWSELWPVIFNIWLGIPLSLSAFLAIMLCMLNDMIISLAMVTEKPETDVMTRHPSSKKTNSLVNWKLIVHAYLFIGNLECFAAFFCYCYYWIDNGVSFYSFLFTYENFGVKPLTTLDSNDLHDMINVAQSIYYCALCTLQMFNFFATRTRYASIFQQNPIWGERRNLYGLGGIAASVVVQLILTQVSWFNQIFSTAPVPVKYVLPAVGFGSLWLVIDELRKLCIRRYPHSVVARIAW